MAAATVMWTRAVTSGTDEAPRKTAALYAKDATLWGSVSDAIRDTPDLIYKYFVSGAMFYRDGCFCVALFGRFWCVEAVLREEKVRRILLHEDSIRIPWGRGSTSKVAAYMARMLFFPKTARMAVERRSCARVATVQLGVPSHRLRFPSHAKGMHVWMKL